MERRMRKRTTTTMVRPAVSWAWLLAVVELAVAASVGVTTTVEATNDEGSQWVSNNGGSTAHPEQPSQSIPSWEELDARPLPSWYDQAKFGIFIHWGVFSVPSYGSEWFWYYWKDMQPDVYGAFVNATERPGFVYSEYATRFTAELYRPEQWAAALAQSGAQYVVLTSKHHEGFCNWDSRTVPTTWNWNAMDVGPKRDILGDLAVQIKQQTSPQTGRRLKFGVYHSMYEWYNPLYTADRAANFTTQHFVDTKTVAELYDLVQQYKPELIWSDGDWEAHSDYWKSREFLHWYATESPVAETAVWNDRWGFDTNCRHGGFVTCTDRYNPDTLQPRKYEDAFTIDTTSWGWNRNSSLTNYLSVKEIVHTLIQVVAFNGNVLLNVGPGSDGTISPIFLDRLRGIGNWLQVNSEAIYDTRPWEVCQNETESAVFYTKKDERLYAHFTLWPADNTLILNFPVATENTQVLFLGLDVKLVNIPLVVWRDRRDGGEGVAVDSERRLDAKSGIEIILPALTPDIVPCEHSWVLVLTGLANL